MSFDEARKQALIKVREERERLGLDSSAMKDSGKKRARPKEKKPVEGPVRRSARVKNLEAPVPTYEEDELAFQTPKRHRVIELNPVELTNSEAAAVLKENAENRDLPAASCRRLRTKVPVLNTSWLGKHVPYSYGGAGRQAKRACMHLLNGDSSVEFVRFSRMSGIQQWSDCVALFVNVGGDEYENLFLEGGRKITWFAQRTQTEISPVILRLIHHETGDPSTSSKTSPSDHATKVVLFCRLPSEPYTYLGQLRYLSHEPGTRPIKFTWELCHFDELKSDDTFQKLLDP